MTQNQISLLCIVHKQNYVHCRMGRWKTRIRT